MNIIIIFTKDRPASLEKTLHSIQQSTFSKFIIDNSISTIQQEKVQRLCKKYTGCNYLGKTEFDDFIKKNKINRHTYSFLLHRPGTKKWNLGYARNFALCYARKIKAGKVLFMDDDIEVRDYRIINHLFAQLEIYPFTGAHISGLVDDSVVGHIATGVKVKNERMLSGGFMAFKPEGITHYFLNYYNEDWIWLFMQLRQKKYLQQRKVFQQLTDPLKNYKDKILFQEFGEIILDGILDLYKQSSWKNMERENFWQRMLKERKEYLDELAAKATKAGNQQYIEILQWLISHSGFKAAAFTKLSEKYFSDKTLFNSLYQSLAK
jgi:glycosyltransferase involved in cell wall biosynthesis